MATSKGANCFAGKDVVAPVSVSAQSSDDSSSIVVRVVNQGSLTTKVILTVVGWGVHTTVKATAVSMASDDLNADNSAADVDNVTPVANSDVTINAKSIIVGLPSHSYTVISLVGSR